MSQTGTPRGVGSADLFVSYAWGPPEHPEHREWTRLLAAHVKTIGFHVLIDADVDYGDTLSGFMRQVTECRHVLLVVDENYVARADTMPESGVGTENKWMSEAHQNKPPAWLSVLFKDNPERRLPAWMAGRNPKGFDFNTHPEHADFPDSEQIEELWRWLEDLPANRDHAVDIATLRERARHLEVIDRERDPGSWSNPKCEDEIVFEYGKAPKSTYRLGGAQYSFAFTVSGRGADSIYVLSEYIRAVGINRAKASGPPDLASQLTPGRLVVAKIGDEVILLNEHGTLCLVELLDVQREAREPVFV
ncbi:MAG: toll/interleukin-1 receptor domain-containing protein, partial [Micrococcales bacterium]|nr:toll/interleukin-1 receptor domain-containing protein [Micrococcales bacterium]